MESKPNTGALFKAEKTSEKHPDYKGTCMIGGEEIYIAAWINKSQKGESYMGLTFTPKSEQAKYSKANTDTTPKPEFAKPVATPVASSDEELPF